VGFASGFQCCLLIVTLCPALPCVVHPAACLQSGTSLSRSSRKLHPPQRPQEGWGLRVTPLGKAAAPRQPYVAAPDGSQRELTADEQLLVERQQPRPRSKIL
jgi:hypothetical protein